MMVIKDKARVYGDAAANSLIMVVTMRIRRFEVVRLLIKFLDFEQNQNSASLDALARR